jgi:hypothetical protein
MPLLLLLLLVVVFLAGLFGVLVLVGRCGNPWAAALGVGRRVSWVAAVALESAVVLLSGRRMSCNGLCVHVNIQQREGMQRTDNSADANQHVSPGCCHSPRQPVLHAARVH